MSVEKRWIVESAEAMESLGKRFAPLCDTATIIFLYGELGAGKTTFTRGFLHGRGHSGNVKSPTYTLVESYVLAGGVVHHFDLYRLGDPEELEYMGIRDYFSGEALCLVEWPERGEGFISGADLALKLKYCSGGRELSGIGMSRKGEEILLQL